MPRGSSKQEIREHVWRVLEETKTVRFPGAVGRIPNFDGARQAAERLGRESAWQAANVLKANPDMPQLPARALALTEEKRIFMAVPRLAGPLPFLELDGAGLDVPARKAASIGGASKHGRLVPTEALPHVDLIVCGTVAVNPAGVRIGKGGGFSDLEFALGVESGRIDDTTVIATTVHENQILEEDLPETEHDFRVDLIVTPERVVRCPRRRRPPGILWDHLDEEKIASIPALAARAPACSQPGGRV